VGGAPAGGRRRRAAGGFAFAQAAVPQLGEAYLAQAQLTAMLVPLGALLGAGAGASRQRRT